VPVDHQLALRYLAQWELEASGVSAHLKVEPIAPSASDRRVIAETISGEVIEQDREGCLWENGERFGDGQLISFCALPDQDELALRIGAPAGWLVAQRRDQSFRFAVYASSQLLWVFSEPDALGVVGTFTGWTLAARHLLPRTLCGDEAYDAARSADRPWMWASGTRREPVASSAGASPVPTNEGPCIA
jgi:hypothetical protein